MHTQPCRHLHWHIAAAGTRPQRTARRRWGHSLRLPPSSMFHAHANVPASALAHCNGLQLLAPGLRGGRWGPSSPGTAFSVAAGSRRPHVSVKEAFRCGPGGLAARSYRSSAWVSLTENEYSRLCRGMYAGAAACAMAWDAWSISRS